MSSKKERESLAFQEAVEHWLRKNNGENAKWARRIYDNLHNNSPLTIEEEEENELEKGGDHH